MYTIISKNGIAKQSKRLVCPMEFSLLLLKRKIESLEIELNELEMERYESEVFWEKWIQEECGEKYWFEYLTEDMSVQLAKSLTSFCLGNFSDALKEIDKAIESCPKCAIAYDYRAYINYRLNNTIAALSDFDKAIQLEDNLSDALFGRAFTKLYLKDYMAAITDFRKAILLGNENLSEYCKRRPAIEDKRNTYTFKDIEDRLIPERAKILQEKFRDTDFFVLEQIAQIKHLPPEFSKFLNDELSERKV